MGFEEIFVFVVAGCVASYRQRSLRLSADPTRDRTQIIFLWILAIALPILAIVWTILNHAALSTIFGVTGFFLCIWMYGNWSPTSNASSKALNLDPTEEKQLKACFPPAIYQLKGLEYRPQEIYCRGNLRSLNPQNAYDTINQNLQKTFGDRFVCYLQESNPENSGANFGAIENEQTNKTHYCFYLIPVSKLTRSPSIVTNRLVWIASVISTIFTVLAVGANIRKLEDINFTNLQVGLPYLLGIASIFIARAIAQYIIAKQNKLQINPPLLLPCIGGFGLLGSLTLKNYTHHRRVLFDLAAIPTIVSIVISLILLVLGNWLLVPVTLATNDLTISLLPNLANFDFKNSIFTSLFQGILQPIFALAKTSEITATLIPVTPVFSPLTLAGWTGLALSALQLLPFDLLDGGNLAIAMFGHRQATQIARMARLVLLAIALLAQPWLRIYSLLLFLLPTPRPLVLNESIEIGRIRDLVGMTLIAIAILIILPAPKSLL